MTEDKDKLLKQLDALKIFPNSKLVRELKNQIKNKLKKLDYTKPEKPKPHPNLSRSNKLKRYHNYIRQIRNNFPNVTYNQIRKQFAKRKRGDDVSIPDAVWQNPSP
ncbi:hypothetical protein [Candidatus Nitrosopumilus sediminis]|uniref:Uncharacterized protein n=1 Tax=Candidatus Nitrosopumilus sediminis TaxID=1229909 RepID=K0BC74_9ARCH|nr:hypothetical protein [Candidatus Nitrosopumilus sediminis]AFS82625.1 hypothetical protein NSED_04095 [Candidatus Nitrosopumilus sediminis]